MSLPLNAYAGAVVLRRRAARCRRNASCAPTGDREDVRYAFHLAARDEGSLVTTTARSGSLLDGVGVRRALPPPASTE